MGGGFNRSIFEHIVSLENLFSAWRKFRQGKTRKPDVIEFSLNLENNIFVLRDELVSGEWQCSGYRKFSIKDPKPRTIHKATVRDRLLYQAVYQILYPLFDKDFVFDSYSSRTGKGTHAGIRRLNLFLRKLSHNYTLPVYALKCDIKKYFDSIDHEILLELVRKKVNCPRAIDLVERIINSFHKTPGKGLPLGNVTSQILANVYLNVFDWYLKKDLNVKYYIRYNDDFIILSRDQKTLSCLIQDISSFLQGKLKLALHPDKIIIRKLNQGIDFLGAVIMSYHIVPRTKTRNRIIKKSLKLFRELQIGKATREKFDQSIASYLGHLSHTKSRKTRHFLYTLKAKVRDLPHVS